MTREEMIKEYENQGMMERGTIKITLEIPKVFERDLYERGFLSENKITECFDRVLSDVNQGNTKTIGRYDKETLEMFKVAFANVEISESEGKESE